MWTKFLYVNEIYFCFNFITQEAGGVMQQLESVLNEKQKEDAKSQSNLQHKKEALKTEQKKLKDIHKNCTSVSAFYFVYS